MQQDELLDLLNPLKINVLIDYFSENKKNRRVAFQGISGSYYALIAARIEPFIAEHQLFIFPDRESALFFYHDLELLLDDAEKALNKKKVHYLPSSSRKSFKWDEYDNTNVKLRSEIVNKLIETNKKLIIVSYPEALTEKLVSRQYIKKNSFTLSVGEQLPVEVLLEFLYEYHYCQEEFVYEPGQFAWRGAIIDIFSYSEEYPFRIELSDDKIESIRTFNLNTQLSVNEVKHAHIMPYINQQETQITRASFFDFLDGKPLYWISKPEDVAIQIETAFKKMIDDFSKREADLKIISPEELYISKETFFKHILDGSVVELSKTLFSHYDLALDFNIVPQNALFQKFNFLLDEWIDNYQKGYKTIFMSENENQRKRIDKIITDLLIPYNLTNQSDYETEKLFTKTSFVLHEGFRDEEGKICIYTDHQFFEKYHRVVVRDRYKKNEQFTLKEVYDLNPGDFVVHIDHGVGIYRGLEKIEVGGKLQEAIKLEYHSGDFLYISIHSLHKITKYVGKEGTAPTLHRIGSGSWEKLKEKTKNRVKEIAIDLINLYAKRKAQKGFAFTPDSYLQTELEASFIYEDTPDQSKSITEVKQDMESEFPMDRLICGDVGFGKTEVAVRAAFKCVCDSKQVAILVPTTILALQHFNTFSERLEKFPCKIDYINRFKTNKAIKESLKELKEGKIDILIGTHRLLSKDVEFKDLGLLVIDEEQKFGVAAKEKLREMKAIVDTLTLSATPIPRTLQFSLMGARDISVIRMPPPNRYPIQTEVHVFNEELIRESISYELSRGGQVFFVNNKIQNIKEVAALIQRLVPHARIAIGHGQMEGDALEKVMLGFVQGDTDVLVATTIVESGLDIANANTIIINDAQNFALNVMHQLRGRVGRNNQKAFCYLLIRSFDELNDQARKRLQAIENYSELGSGFQIAMRDLDIRGAGNILGAEQSGFISEIGFEMYQKILNEAIQELQEKDFTSFDMADNSALLQRECILETDLGVMLPSDYVASVNERMSLYKELETIKDDNTLAVFRTKLTDVFGTIPPETEELLQTVPLRRKAGQLFFDKIVLKKGNFTGYFIANINSPFYQSELFSQILTFMQKNHPQVQMKEINQKPVLTIKHVPTIKSAMHWLNKIDKI